MYSDVSLNKYDIEYIYEFDENGRVDSKYINKGYYVYLNDNPSVKNKYNFGHNTVEYNVYERKNWFGNIKYTFERDN